MTVTILTGDVIDMLRELIAAIMVVVATSASPKVKVRAPTMGVRGHV